jgi:hypothetical protein
MSKSVFINYRRDDSAAEARLVANDLRRVLPSESVFLDIEAIRPGEKWPERIRAALDLSQLVFVVIGPTWLTAGIDEWGRRRIDVESDWVRQEIATALGDSRKTVVALLVCGAKMPPTDALPDKVAGINTRQYIEIRRDFWEIDFGQVTNLVNTTFGVTMVDPPSAMFGKFWNELSPDLQDALALAATDARRNGREVISTRTLFAALRRLHPEPLREFFDHLPSAALPEALPESLSVDRGALAEIDSFSTCVQDSLAHLTLRASSQQRVSAEDIFIDIARHGKGKSVQRLRTYGVDVSRVNEIVGQLGWRILERAGG